MKRTLQFLLAMMTMVGSLSVVAQDDGKIIVEITKEVNGEKKTFKGEYSSTEEMKADPNYQGFAGSDDTNFWFGPGDEDIVIHLDDFDDMGKHFFKLFDDDGGNSFFFHHDDDSLNGFFNFHLDDMDWEEYSEKMKDLGIEMEKLIERFDDGDRQVKIIELKRIRVMDVEDEFGKKGKVDESNKLELEDLTFYPNPSSNGRFKVRFTTPIEGELSIKVSNLEGKEVFNRYFESFSGKYSESIDLSGQKEGMYLLEISQGQKRLTKKIVIN